MRIMVWKIGLILAMTLPGHAEETYSIDNGTIAFDEQPILITYMVDDTDNYKYHLAVSNTRNKVGKHGLMYGSLIRVNCNDKTGTYYLIDDRKKGEINKFVTQLSINFCAIHKNFWKHSRW